MSLGEFRILLIDDDEDDFVIIRDLLAQDTRSAYRVTWKSNFQEGLDAYYAEKFDACLLDYRLGKHTGLELLKEIQSQGATCPIIFLTGIGHFELDLQAMQIGAADYLVKDQLTSMLLERSIRYAMKHAYDMEELKESKAQILQQDRLASLGLLASSLAHEIGTPLGIIRSRAELAERRAGENAALKQDMSVVITQIDRITKLVNSLLHLAREKKSEYASSVNLNQVIQDVVNLVRHEFDRNNIFFELDSPVEIIVKAEAGPLGQVLLNLLVNAVHAIQYSQKNEKRDNHKITLKVVGKSDSIEIWVRDTGCGIPKNNLGQIFKPFFTTKEVGVGTGLGLATSYKLVQSWGGTIEIESQDNQGALFKVKLLKFSK